MLDILVKTDFRPSLDFKGTTHTFSITHLLNRGSTEFNILKTLQKRDLITDTAQICRDSTFLHQNVKFKMGMLPYSLSPS